MNSPGVKPVVELKRLTRSFEQGGVKIDVLRGSNSTIWGSEAVGGVIDISTRTDRGLSGSVEYGARDTLFASAAAGAGNDRVFFGLTGSWY